MNSRDKQEMIEELNALIEMADEKLEQYNKLNEPLIKVKLQQEYHNDLLESARSKKDANNEDVILSELKTKIANLTPREHELAKLDAEIQSIRDKIEALEKKISGTSNPDSPSFLLKK